MEMEEEDSQDAFVTASVCDVQNEPAITGTRNVHCVEHCLGESSLEHHDVFLNEDSKSDSPPPTSTCKESYISTDSEDQENFDLIRTLGHYRRGQRQRRHSSSSVCSCESCASHSDDSFFGSEEGPRGGENTIQRRVFMWLEDVNMNWGFLVPGLLILSVVFSIIAFVITETSHNLQVGWNILYWTVPLVAVTAGIVIAWRVARHLLLRRGFDQGDHILERWNLIRDAQAKELVYSVRGAIYAPTCREPPSHRRPPVYKVVGYESEFDSETYFDSDLESDGQYRRSLTPWQEVEESSKKERRNIYTRRAWFRDVPVVWWELLPHTNEYL